MIAVRQAVSTQQDQVDQQSDLTLSTERSTPSSRYQSTVFGIPAIFFGLVLSLGLVGDAALACECDASILGNAYCDQFLAMCRRHEDITDTVRKQVDKYGWDVCNKSSEAIYAAYASAYPGYGYTREGWHTINPGSCKRVITESMRDKNYYTRIERSNGSSKTRKDKSFCMWPPQPDGSILTADFDRCRKVWKVQGNKSFKKMKKSTGWVTTVR